MLALTPSDLFRKLFAFTGFLAVLCVPIVGIWIAAVSEQGAREDILANGSQTFAEVVQSRPGGKGCTFHYDCQHEGRVFRGKRGGCPLASRFKKGDVIKIRYDASEPEQSMPVGGDTFPGWGIVPFLIAPFLIFIYLVIVVDLVRQTYDPNYLRQKQHN